MTTQTEAIRLKDLQPGTEYNLIEAIGTDREFIWPATFQRRVTHNAFPQIVEFFDHEGDDTFEMTTRDGVHFVDSDPDTGTGAVFTIHPSTEQED